MTVISIQSLVVHGCVGNSAAVLPMQTHGLTVAPVPTTLLSNHPHYPTMRGRVLSADLISDLLQGIEERGLVETSSAIVTGFLGSEANGKVVADFVTRAKRRNPNLFYVFDPVSGDDDIDAFAESALFDIFKEQLLPLADVATPNRWELRQLTSIQEQDDDVALARSLIRDGPSCVIVTGGATTGKTLSTTVVEPRRAWTIRSPRINVRTAGTGDLFTALFTARRLLGDTNAAAASHAVGSTFSVLERTSPAPWSELPVAECIEELLMPTREFPPVALINTRPVEHRERWL